MRTPLKSTVRANIIRPLPVLFILLIGAIGVQTITSCSGDDGGDSGGKPSDYYCIYPETQTCILSLGTLSDCPSNGILSNACPYGSSSSVVLSSSSNSSSSVAASSSSPVNNNGSSPSAANTYELNYDGNSFTFIANERYECVDGGILRKDYDETGTMHYSIYYSTGNNILALTFGDTINFKGTSNNLIGTWTRTKNKAASCKLKTERYCKDYDSNRCECREYKETSFYDCKYGWDITKLVFTQNTVAITQDYCYTDKLLNGEENSDGWKYNIINCDTYELSKGTEKARIKITTSFKKDEAIEVTYNGKTCKWSEYSVSQRAKACSDAWEKIQAQGGSTHSYELQDYYYNFLEKDLGECTKNFPKDILSDDADDPYYCPGGG